MRSYALLGVLCIAFVACEDEIPTKKSSHDLIFDELPKVWDEAVPLGNGTVGVLIWERGDTLRMALDRADLWDKRPMANRNIPEFSFKWVMEQRMKDTDEAYRKVQLLYDEPYLTSPGPTKIPGGVLAFDTKKFGNVQDVRLHIKEAICEVNWDSGLKLQTFVHAEKSFGYFLFTGNTENVQPGLIVPEYDVKSYHRANEGGAVGKGLGGLEYKAGNVITKENSISYKQNGWGDFKYTIDVRWDKKADGVIEGTWSISSSDAPVEQDNSAQIAQTALESGFNTMFVEHKSWWENFWSKSSITLPDSVLERQWYLDQYKFGSVARADAPPISLQAIWTADNGDLPPWKGDFHNDLNTQLSYWPAYSGNHLDLEIGFINWIWDNREVFKKYTKDFYGTSGINVPGVATLEGKPMGGWIQYAFGPTVSAWLAHHFYLHWRYSMDRGFLEERAYPWFMEVATYLDELSTTGKNGKKKLPLSTSPEYHHNTKEAWYKNHSSFDVGLKKFTFIKVAELARELGKMDEAKKWDQKLSEWELEYPINETGLLIAPRYPYVYSHHHFSHLLPFHPLGLLDVTHGEEEAELIRRSIENCEKIESKNPMWTGYMYAWLGGMKARMFDGEGAAEELRKFPTAFVTKNSFHANGDYKKTGTSNFTGRFVTLEGNFAFASGLQEMLIQSHTGIVRIFPAIPDGWNDLSFKRLRTKGAFLISASRESSKVKMVKVESEKGGTIKLNNPFGNEKFTSESKEITKEGNMLLIEMKPGEVIDIKI